ncbi:MAG: acyl-CoA dehydrogenase family protein [Fimbriimonadales bacterium]
MSRDAEILSTAETYLRDEVAPNASAIDADPAALKRALDGLGRHDLMALRRPETFGGPALSEEAFRQFQESVARYSGALAFLQTQHQSAGSMIAKGDNANLKTEYLPKMGNGERLVGIGFSQLRRPGPPILSAHPVAGGYRLTGHVPWVTGHGFYSEFLIGASLSSGEAVFGIVPFEDRDHEGSIRFSEPMRLVAMESARTVTADLVDWFLPDDLVVYVKPAGWIQNNDMINVTLQGHFAIGCARAGLDVVELAAQRKGHAFLEEAARALAAEIDACRKAMADSQSNAEMSTEERLGIRAWAIDLAGRCAHAGVVASSGAAISLSNPAQRVLREAMVFSVSAQTTPIMDATLRRLVRR